MHQTTQAICLLTVFGLIRIAAFAGVDEKQINTPIMNSGLPEKLVTVEKSEGWNWGDPITLADGMVIIDGEERLRFELRNNNFDFNDSVNNVTDDSYLLQRFRVGVMAKPLDWMTLYVQGQDSREIDSDRPDVPFVLGSEGDNTFNLRQAWIQLGNPKEFPLSTKIGRQTLIYGDERLIGAFDWNNFGRTFDAIKVTYDIPAIKTSIDAFVANVVTIRPNNQTNNDSYEFNGSDPYDLLTGLYAKSDILDFQTTEAYFIYRDKTRNGPIYSAPPFVADSANAGSLPYDVQQEVYTVGGRVKSSDLKKLHGFDYEAEGAYQFGSTDGRNGTVSGGAFAFPTGSALNLSAFAAHGAAGYTWMSSDWKPRVGVQYDVASGDDNPSDGSSQTFMNLFPTNHKFYGAMDLFAWKNIHNPSYNFSIKPMKDLTLTFAHQFFWLYTTQDGWYRANGVAQVRPLNASAMRASNYVGNEIDLTATYSPIKNLGILVGYSHFFAGDYVKDTQAGTNGPDDADFFYLQSTVKF